MTARFGVVYTIGPFAGFQATHDLGSARRRFDSPSLADDAKTWQNVTPPAMTPWSKVLQIEASHFDAETAYASVDRHRIADTTKPYIYRTHDGARTWQNGVAGIPEGAFVQLKLPKAKSLALRRPRSLRVYVSFNDGRRQWQAIAEQHAVTSIRRYLSAWR